MQKKILVVDDEPQILKAIRYYLEDEGYEVLTAESGKEAIELAERYNPDLIVLDVIMPFMDGFEVCRELRSRRSTHLVPIIFLTARERLEDKITGFDLGGDDYITKPFNNRELLARIKSRLRRSEEEIFSHPITGLPGGGVVEREANSRLQSGKPVAALFILLDNFDSYCRAYGVSGSNRFIKFVAQLISSVVESQREQDFLGQNMEEEFIVFTHPSRSASYCQEIVERFEERKLEYLTDLHRQKGEISYYDFKGNLVHAPFPWIKIACLNTTNRFVATFSSLSRWGAQAIAKARALDGSAWIMEE